MSFSFVNPSAFSNINNFSFLGEEGKVTANTPSKFLDILTLPLNAPFVEITSALF